MIMDQKQLDACDRLARIFTEFDVTNRGQSCWAVRLKHKEIADAELFVDVSKDKWEFSGCWPMTQTKYTHKPKEDKSVGVNSQRDDYAIFKDVQNRLLKWYFTELEIQKKNVQESDNRLNRRNERLNALLQAIGEPIRERNQDSSEVYIYQSSLFESIKLSYDGESVDLKLNNIDFNLALELIDVLKSFDKKLVN